jgi:hypothetical protein
LNKVFFLQSLISQCQTARQQCYFWSAPGILFPRYPPYLVSIPPSAARGGARWKTSNSSRGHS